ncbi:MAG: hypothetical protein L6R28_17985 [Planctomycetes bacterium]|nr:hypothetical protein [Planctomycetota bacterium]
MNANHLRMWVMLFDAWLFVCISTAAQEGADEAFRVKREDVFEFAAAPGITRDGDRVEIVFETKGFCDVTVAIEDSGGRIVRHLASGVLGVNAPAPFAKGEKKQRLVWDGKDDSGRYVDDKNSHSVRVSLGLKPQFEKTLFWSPYKRVPFRFVTRAGDGASYNPPVFAAAEEGVYVFDSTSDIDQLRLYDRKGDYKRTVYPFPAGKLGEVQGIKRVRFPQSGRELPFKNFYYGTTMLTSGISTESGLYRLHPSMRDGGSSATAMAVAGGRVALAEVSVNRLAGDGSTGGIDLSGPHVAQTVRIDNGKEVLVSPRSAALSPGAKWLYLTGYFFHGGHPSSADWDWLPAVFRVPYSGEGKLEVFAGDAEKGKTGTAPGAFQAPMAVACDAKGRVYVADYLNDRIQVFGEDGKFLKALAVNRPVQVVVHPKTQDLFVFSWYVANQLYYSGKGTASDDRLKPKMIHFGAFDAPEVKANYTLPLVGHPGQRPTTDYTGMQFRATVDGWADPPAIWLVPGGASAHTTLEEVGLRVLVPKDGKLVQVRDFSADAKRAVARLKPPSEYRQRLYVNPAKPNMLYVGEGQVGVRKAFTTVVAIDAETGKCDELELPLSAEDLCFDAEGFAFLRTGNEVVRYDSRTWREVPWDYGEEKSVQFSSDSKGSEAMSALILPQTSTYWHHPGLGVNSKGELAVGCYTDSERHSRKEETSAFSAVKGKHYAVRLYPGRPKGATVYIWDRHGKMIREDAVTSLGTVDGVQIDSDGNVYAAVGANRMVGDKPYFDYMAGSWAKLKAGESKALTSSTAVPVAMGQASAPKRQRDLAPGNGPEWLDGAEWIYGGVGFSGLNAKHFAGACACWNYRCTLDFFARSFAPEVQHGSVAVLDAAGNVLVRIGQYGNADDGVPLNRAGGPASPQTIGGDEVALFYAPYVATLTDRRLYIADPGNARILSVRLGYHTDRKLPLGEAR